MLKQELFFEAGWAGRNKHGETLCGDYFKIFDDADKQVFVLSDGLGSGVKANILSTLTATILGTMLSNGISLDECVNTVAMTLPICRVRKLAYSTFSILQVENAMARLIQFDNPDAIVMRRGKNLDYSKSIHFIEEKEIHESQLLLEIGDTMILMSDGVTNAGIGKLAPGGWGRNDVIKLLERMDLSGMSATRIAATIADCCIALSQGSLDDDTTILAVKIRERMVVNMMIGPPENKADDNRIMKLFFAKTGIRVVCGGSTARAVSAFTKNPLSVIEGSETEDIPCMGRIKDVDYVTEGIITLRRVLELLNGIKENPMSILEIVKGSDAASILTMLLAEQATDVYIYFGMAENSAHEGTDIDFQTKLTLVKDLEKCLQSMKKNVRISFC